MARSGISISYDDKNLQKNVQLFRPNVRSAINAVVDRRAAETEKWLKQNAPWTDRTGAARVGLTAIPNHGDTFEEILMAYSVTYGIWLEVANDRRFAVIGPAINIQGQALMADLQYLLDRMATAALTPTPTRDIPKQQDKPGRHSNDHRRGHHAPGTHS